MKKQSIVKKGEARGKGKAKTKKRKAERGIKRRQGTSAPCS
jgi:hypothetical protein